MSDVLRVRDHTQPCKHDTRWSHHDFATGPCPGGREIVLRRESVFDMDTTKQRKVWVEVEDDE